MSDLEKEFELIDDLEVKYPSEHFIKESVIKYNINEILEKIKIKINNFENRIKQLEIELNILKGVVKS